MSDLTKNEGKKIKTKKYTAVRGEERGAEHQKWPGKRCPEGISCVTCTTPGAKGSAGSSLGLVPVWAGCTSWLVGCDFGENDVSDLLGVRVILLLKLWRVTLPPVAPDSSDPISFMFRAAELWKVVWKMKFLVYQLLQWFSLLMMWFKPNWNIIPTQPLPSPHLLGWETKCSLGAENLLLL